ncbi:MAG: DUF3841 domain-containing protein, partial [Planctomycetaceae bacterium]|nr:DUF3841 domain-containing protein [Planctomycetaceae bacterium]
MRQYRAVAEMAIRYVAKSAMKLWTIQTVPAWQSLQEHGYLRGQRRHADRDFLPAYDWIATQMRQRIGQPPSAHISVPIWAWHQYDGIHRKRPDLRSSGYLPTGTRGYRIGFTIPDSCVLLSDFELWHYALDYWYLASSESDAEAFGLLNQNLRCSWSNPPSDHRVNSTIERSWHRMFDLHWHDPYVTAPRDEKSIQATLWQLDHSWIKTVDEFVAR